MQGTCELVIDAKAMIGESPTWSAAEKALYWIDVKAPALFRYHPDSGEQRCWDADSDLGGFALGPHRTALLAVRDGPVRLDLKTGQQTPIAPAPFDRQLFRFNEGACDQSGRFWIGVMFDPVIAYDGPPQAASLHVYSNIDGLRPEPDTAELHNGMAWTQDENGFLLSHSQERTIYRYDYDRYSGRLGDRCVFVTIPEQDGVPDGAAIDVEGGYWCALHGGGALRRFHADGSHDRDITLPVSQPTMCTFGGRDLQTLYVTSAAQGLSTEALAKEPHAGGLFQLHPGIAGIPRSIMSS